MIQQADIFPRVAIKLVVLNIQKFSIAMKQRNPQPGCFITEIKIRPGRRKKNNQFMVDARVCISAKSDNLCLTEFVIHRGYGVTLFSQETDESVFTG